MATPSASETTRTTKSGIDLSSFADVKMFKDVPTVAEVASVNDALARLGNDHAKLLMVIRDGLQAHTIEQARNEPTGWKLFDENDNETETEFSGTLVTDTKDLNQTILNMAKIMFGYDEADAITDVEKKREAKRQAKESAKEFIRSNEKILAGLKARAAKASSKSE